MVTEHRATRLPGGTCGQYDLPDYDAALVEIRNDYRWTPACQRAFLEELAATGSVLRAVLHVGKTARAAYSLRQRREGGAFRLGWDAAVLIARCALEGLLMDRAVNGYEEVSSRSDDGTVLRSKFDNRLGLGLLGRLDRIAATQPVTGSMAAQVQLVSQDWESFLELVADGGTGAAAALFCGARGPVDPATSDSGFDCELAQNSADFADDDGAEEELAPEAAAAQMSVWYDPYGQCWKTDFPPRTDEDTALVSESGMFGDQDYLRTLTPAEETAQIAAEAARRLPLHQAALAAHAEWFGLKAAA